MNEKMKKYENGRKEKKKNYVLKIKYLNFLKFLP